MSNMRLILCANSTSKLIAPIRSRCLLMRVAAPDASEVRAYFSPLVRVVSGQEADPGRGCR